MSKFGMVLGAVAAIFGLTLSVGGHLRSSFTLVGRGESASIRGGACWVNEVSDCPALTGNGCSTCDESHWCSVGHSQVAIATEMITVFDALTEPAGHVGFINGGVKYCAIETSCELFCDLVGDEYVCLEGSDYYVNGWHEFMEDPNTAWCNVYLAFVNPEESEQYVLLE
jgi:hypothetical protein